MVQVLSPDSRRSFAQSIMGGLAEGTAQAIPEYFQRQEMQNQQKAMAQQLAQENELVKNNYGVDLAGINDPKLRQQILGEQLKQTGKEKLIGKQQQFLSQLGIGGKQNQDLNLEGENKKLGFDPLNISDQEILQANALDPNLGKTLESLRDTAFQKHRDEQKANTAKQGKYFDFNEPKLAAVADSERKLNIENARYARLGELFSDPSKFPSGLTAALFTKEGQLNDIAYSQLSPEAQEAVKLIIDSTSNIKDTYGARVTNFDLQTYLRKLPSLMNSPEGRTRVLRDLQELNKINQIYNEGIQEVFDEACGTDQIPWSTAEKRFKKKYGKELNTMLENFSTPENKVFNEKPDPSKYLGKKLEDKETGEIFISDGKDWKLYGDSNAL